MKPFQSLRAWWRLRDVCCRVLSPSSSTYLFGVEYLRWSGLVGRDAESVRATFGRPTRFDPRFRAHELRVGVGWSVRIAWFGGIEPEPLTPAQLAFRRTRRSARRVLFLSALAAAFVIAWATYVAVSWYDGEVSGVVSGIHTGFSCAVLCLVATMIAGCVDDIRATRERERVTVERETPAR